jgi:hypothetical protein
MNVCCDFWSVYVILLFLCVTLRKEGWGECCGYSKVSVWWPPFVSVKDRAILALIACFELCTCHMSGFMGPGKPSSFCN